MTYQDLLSAIGDLSTEERLRLIEVLSRSLRTEQATGRASASSAARVRGMLRPIGGIPADSELADTYTRYLIEKYT